jgi:Fic family protein
MEGDKVHLIWNPDTGIKDFEVDPNTLGASEISGIRESWKEQKSQLEGTPQLLEFTERLGREWAIETGVIENLYNIDRGVTQTLIEHGFQAELLEHGSTNKPREYVLRLLRDQRNTLEGIFDFVKSERELTTSYIKELHQALLRSQETTEGLNTLGQRGGVTLIKGDWKKQQNHPVRNGVMYAYCPPEQVESEMDRLIDLHSCHVRDGNPSELQAAWLHHRFTQIHPFQDGNGRVARALASLVFLKDGLFPLVITRDDRKTYIRALEVADQSELAPLIHVFVKSQSRQFKKASKISEEVLREGSGTRGALRVLRKAAENQKINYKTRIESHAKIIEEDLKERLKGLALDIKEILEETPTGSDVTVHARQSDEKTDYYFRSQIIDNAKSHFEYYADTSRYRSWISLQMYWSRRARLVFPIHGIGKRLGGGLICAPFLEFTDFGEEGEPRVSLVPVSEDGFIFFQNEKPEQLKDRFDKWREEVLEVFILELSQNL